MQDHVLVNVCHAVRDVIDHHEPIIGCQIGMEFQVGRKVPIFVVRTHEERRPDGC